MVQGGTAYFVVSVLLLFGPTDGLSGLPTLIKLTDARHSNCYLWVDPFKENEKPLEPENYPVQTSFFAKKAISGKCSEMHHFQIFYKETIGYSSGHANKETLTSTFCRKKAKSSLKFRDLPNYVYVATVGNKKKGFHSACLMAGSVSLGSKAETYYFEELFNSRIRRVSN